MAISRTAAACAVAAAAVLQMPVRAGAASYPFAITVDSSRDSVAIICSGPNFRSRDCRTVLGRGARTVFYTAETTIFPVQGDWACAAFTSCFVGSQLATHRFCGPNAGPAPKQVELALRSSGGSTLSSNQASSCDEAAISTPILARSVLGQTGEADPTRSEDRDTYVFDGKAGEAVEVLLARDGSTGSAGAVATLRLRSRGGAVLGEETGPVPLRLKATLPGEVEVLVLRDGKAANALRGGYQISVTPASGELSGRSLRPTENVEG